ncbi:MAG: 4a-hydroxytetrahydrobiopterin dehydratase [Candidatus Dormibacteraeota bacterium]|nr:4a-hydroxytetrahydrobiopterin dehydratase [Candidatus Dormibacteraeota bacterium]
MALADQKCVACTAETPPLTGTEVAQLLSQVDGWQVNDAGHLTKDYKLKNFVAAVDLVNAITPVAEEEGHHPDLHVGWGRVGVELWTHAIDGLSEADFVMAAKIDRVSAQSAGSG